MFETVIMWFLAIITPIPVFITYNTVMGNTSLLQDWFKFVEKDEKELSTVHQEKLNRFMSLRVGVPWFVGSVMTSTSVMLFLGLSNPSLLLLTMVGVFPIYIVSELKLSEVIEETKPQNQSI